MRFIIASIGTILVTTVIFLFMQGLIEQQQQDEILLVVHEPIEIIKKQQQEDEKRPEEEPQETPNEEPVMEELQVSPLSPQPDVELQVPALDLATGDLAITAVGDKWSAPLGAGNNGIAGGQGLDAQGFVEVVPFSTRKPNVPELAWKNKINGWVLVAFNVTAEGRTRNIRILDAMPRGVFEERVISAVTDWRYSVRFSGDVKGEVVVTQKVELQWKDFPMNIPNAD
jgi:protein TonB